MQLYQTGCDELSALRQSHYQNLVQNIHWAAEILKDSLTILLEGKSLRNSVH